MTWSLQLRNGDIQKGKGNSLATTTGYRKVEQDLFAWIMTELGESVFTPSFGSMIEFEPGGMIELGTGDVLYVNEDRIQLIISEIHRIIEEYQKRQLSRLRLEVAMYGGKHTFDPGEIIQDYRLEYEDVLDSLYVDIYLSLLSGVEGTLEIKL